MIFRLLTLRLRIWLVRLLVGKSSVAVNISHAGWIAPQGQGWFLFKNVEHLPFREPRGRS